MVHVLDRDVWSQCSRMLQKGKIINQTFKDTLTFMLHSLDSEELIEFAVVTWSLWKRRNDFIFQKRFLTPNRLLKQISQRLQDLKAINLVFPIQQTLTPVDRCVWVAPPKDIIKINWDVAIDKKTCKIGMGLGRTCTGHYEVEHIPFSRSIAKKHMLPFMQLF
ncbi:hypothetical protein I3842_16G087400 [Carya illinoinensis]|uniref:Uncharacterized protein n=1 Tax=Carya illinoinensis TaxID=32201 RepID=A0A922A5Z5_CARIL|nr:hypothetical protein I3842_16G087400 [Carya illinoinensis]